MIRNRSSNRSQNGPFALARKAGASLLAASLSLWAAPDAARAWSQHYLITELALSHPAIEQDPGMAALGKASLETRVPVVSLDEFVSRTQAKLPALVAEYGAWLETRGGKRFRKTEFRAPGTPGGPASGREAFLRAFRLNPDATFPLVQRILPGGGPEFSEVPSTRVNAAVSPKPSLPAADWIQRFDDVKGRRVTLRSVLVTFSDEPDWGMDQELWSVPEYGYGEPPYGAKKGIASQAAFHMLFKHENWLTRLAAPELGEGMTIERIELFRRLSKFAFENGQPYWGARFAAWGLHYVQDLTQPYHARSVPEAGYLWTLKYVFTFDKAKLKRDTMALVKSRHFLYEDVMAFSLQQARLERIPAFDGLAHAIDGGTIAYPESVSADSNAFALQITRRSAGHAPKVDEAIVEAFPARMTRDPAYDLELDAAFRIRQVVADVLGESRRASALYPAAMQDHEEAGRVTRGLLRSLLPLPTRAH